MQDIKELRVAQYDSNKKAMYFAKELLRGNEKINITSGTNSASVATIAAEALCRLGYITYENIRTETIVDRDRRRIRFVIAVKKTANFEKLYVENEENRKKKEAERLAKETQH